MVRGGVILQREEPLEALESHCATWSLTAPKLHSHSPLAHVYIVTQQNGQKAVLKIFTPHGIEDEWDGACLLQWYQGKSAVEVLALAGNALLMRYLSGASLMALCDDGRSDQAALIAAKLVATARAQTHPPPPLKTVNQRFEFLFRFDQTKIPKPNREVYLRGLSTARKMLASAEPFVPLHGDLHFRNVLHDGEQWRLIDPKGLLGPPAYDLANLFINPWDRPDIVLAKGRARRLAEILCQQTGHPTAELIGWAIAHAAIAAAWHISNGGSGRHPLAALAYLQGAQTSV